MQQIQVECLTASVVAFVVMVELIALLGRNDDVLSGKKYVVVFPARKLAFPPSNVCILPRNAINSTVTTNVTTETVKRST